jgi:polysaccharide biosynthesis protein PslG
MGASRLALSDLIPRLGGPVRHVVALFAALLLALVCALGPVARPGVAARQGDTLVHGVIVDTTNPASMRLAREAGFTHAKMVLYWPRLEPNPGQHLWRETPENDLDNVMKAAGAENLLLVLRVDQVPVWAGGSPANADPAAIEAFYAAMAAHGRGRVVAYEILNEPNLPFEWGGPPSPAGYAEFLKAAYRGVKASDPAALVIGGGPSPNTGGFGGTVEDTDFLDGMYAAGARGYFDVLGVHNYGGNVEPERDPADCGICFRRAELYRDLMVRHGDAATPIWATEFGWLLDPGWGLGQYDWMKVSAEQQAAYVAGSYRYAAERWPWMTGMLLSNLDASTSPYHTGPEDGLPWFAILNADHSPRPAYESFKQMRAAAAPARQDPVAAGQAAAPPPAERAAPPGGPVVRVANTGGEGVSLRAQPSAGSPRLALVPEGGRLEVMGEDRAAEGRTWRNVRQPGGPVGWVAADYLAGDE